MTRVGYIITGIVSLLFWTALIHWLTEGSSFLGSLGSALFVQFIGSILMASEESRDDA